MRLVEFALQGVRGFEEARKLAFQAGYNLLTGPNESGKTTCLLAMLATLEPERLAGDEARLVPPRAAAAPRPPRCGLAFVHDGRTYRLVRDLVQGAANLSVLDPGSGRFVPEQRDAAAIRRWLREVAGMPALRLFDTLLLLERTGMPSARLAPARGRGGSAPAAAASPAPAVPAAPAEAGPARAARIAELRADIARVEALERVEFQLDGVKARLFEVDAELADVRKLDALAVELEAGIEEFERLGLEPEQVEARARVFRTLVERREADLAAVAAERDALETRVAIPVTPVTKDPLVLAGTAGALACLVAGVWFPAAFAGAVIGAGAVVAGAVRGSQAVARRREALAGLAALDERVQAIEKRHDIETRSVRTAQEALGVSGPEGLIERIEGYYALKARRDALAERREAITRQKDLPALDAERARLTGEIRGIEERLRGFGAAAAFDAGELRRELAALEGRTAPAGSAPREHGAGGADAAGRADRPGADDGTSAWGAAGARGPLDEALGTWLDVASRVLGESHEAVARALLRRAQPLVAPLSAERHRSVALDADGRLTVVSAGGHTAQAADLSPATQDAVYLALRLAGFALLAPHCPWPLLLDDPLGALDDARLAAACRAIRAAAREGGQVLHLTARKLPAALADGAQALG